MDAFSFPQLLGYAAYTISLIAATQKKDNNLFLLFTFSNALFGLHHFLLGNLSAAASKIIVGLRMCLNIRFKGAVIAFPFATIAVISGYYTYQVPVSVLPVIAVVLATFVAAYSGGIKLRICFIVCCSLWLIHNIVRHSIGGSIEETTNIVIYATTVWRMKKDHRKLQTEKV